MDKTIATFVQMFLIFPGAAAIERASTRRGDSKVGSGSIK